MVLYSVAMIDSVFTKIIIGELPCYKIYEDELTLAFLDIHPVQPGHMLVIPKQQIEFVWDLPDDLYQAVMNTSKMMAIKMRSTLPQKYVHERIVGLDVPHAHVQLIPFDVVEDLLVKQDMNSLIDHEGLSNIHKSLIK
jgi:histidine triad (HIT) family protein